MLCHLPPLALRLTIPEPLTPPPQSTFGVLYQWAGGRIRVLTVSYLKDVMPLMEGVYGICEYA